MRELNIRKLSNKNVGLICVILGSVFFVAGITVFILTNAVNLYSQKTEATIVSRYKIESEEGAKTMLELAYRVGDEMVYTAQSFPGEIDEEQLTMDVYYNIKNPKELLDAGWHIETIVPVLFGVLIFMVGMYYMGKFSIGPDSFKKPGSKASDWDRKYYDTKERVENGLIPLFGVISFIVFGIFMLVNKSGWWAWIFIVIGGIATVYILIDVVPAITEFIVLNKIKKYKNKSLSIDDDFDKFEKSKKDIEAKKANEATKSGDDKKADGDGLDFEIEDTIEIKSLKTTGKKKKK